MYGKINCEIIHFLTGTIAPVCQSPNGIYPDQAQNILHADTRLDIRLGHGRHPVREKQYCIGIRQTSVIFI